jgi:tetratricopeptide (TPR) repeat protein
MKKYASLLIVLLVVVSGCAKYQTANTQLIDPLIVQEAADLSRGSEVFRVETMAQNREKYKQNLVEMVLFYDRQGSHEKANWAQNELAHLSKYKPQAFLTVVDIASPDLRASVPNEHADIIFAEARVLVIDGNRLFANPNKLLDAVNKFEEIITNYPSSDKIDDAAWETAEINSKHFYDYGAAIKYYQRVWQWDPETTYPARFKVAKIYEDVFHARDKALIYYRDALEKEQLSEVQIQTAQNRIKLIMQNTSK